jgi:hypothetical protein
MSVVYILLSIFALALVFYLLDYFWGFYDKLLPARHSNLGLDDLREHVGQFLKRGRFDGRMVLELEDHDRPVRYRQSAYLGYMRTEIVTGLENLRPLLFFRKWYKIGREWMEYYVLFDDTEVSREAMSEFERSLQEQGFRCGYGITRWRRHDRVLACQCDDLDQAMQVTRQAIEVLYRLPETARFSVYVQGHLAHDKKESKGIKEYKPLSEIYAPEYRGRPYHHAQLGHSLIVGIVKVVVELIKRAMGKSREPRQP